MHVITSTKEVLFSPISVSLSFNRITQKLLIKYLWILWSSCT